MQYTTIALLSLGSMAFFCAFMGAGFAWVSEERMPGYVAIALIPFGIACFIAADLVSR